MDMETWTWRHGHGDMDMETWTWRHGHGDMEAWRHGRRDMDMETWSWRHGNMGTYTWRHEDIKRKMEAQAIFLNLFTVWSSCKQKFVVCPYVDEETMEVISLQTF
jgi:hypothetical protein